MKKLCVGLLGISLAAASFGQTYGVVPNGYDTTAGTGGFLFLVTTGRTYQYEIQASQLTAFVGKNLTGLQWRLLQSATTAWPPNDVSFSSFDIYMGPGVEPSAQSTTFANNFTGTVTQVRSGALTITGGSFPITGTPHDWGPTISFSPYLYTGGNLSVEMTHTGMVGTATTASFDAITTATSGYGTAFSSQWTGSYNGVSGATTANFFVTRFTASAVPEPASVVALSLGGLALLRRRRQSSNS